MDGGGREEECVVDGRGRGGGRGLWWREGGGGMCDGWGRKGRRSV